VKLLKKIKILCLLCFLVFNSTILVNHKQVEAQENNTSKQADALPAKGNSSEDFSSEHVLVGMHPNILLPRSQLNGELFPEIEIESVEVILSPDSNTRSSKSIGDTLLLKLKENNKQAVLQAIELLKEHPDVEYAEPDYITYIDNFKNEEPIPSLAHVSNPLLWNMEKIKLREAWDITRGNSSITVGVIDSGIDHTHPNLAPNVDTSLGYNFALDTNNAKDEYGHGTFVAGLIGAVGNNDHNMFGIAPKVTLIPLKVKSPNGSLLSSNIVKAINHANSHKIDILNYSNGNTKKNQAIENAIRAYNGLFVNSAGNNGQNIDIQPYYPSSFNIPNMIVVGNSNQQDERRATSNYGKSTVDLFAPGTYVTSTSMGGGFSTSSGTSFSAPHVTGAAVLALSMNPSLTPIELKTKIIDDVNWVFSLSNLCVSGGRLNVERLVRDEQILPKEYWLPYNHGGFGTFNDIATNGDVGIHNMARATISNEIYYNLNKNFKFDGSSQKLGNNVGDSITGFIVIPTTPKDFSHANNYMDLGYTNHRGWNNVWQYQRSGNLGAGMHDRSQYMAKISPFPQQSLKTMDGTVEIILSYTVNNTIIVTLRRLQNGPTTNTTLWSNAPINLPIQIHVNRWNGPGTRVNDYNKADVVTIFNERKGPLAAWNIRQVLLP
jgi:hypothetical protein